VIGLSLAMPVSCSHGTEPENAGPDPVSVVTAVARVGTLVDRATATGNVVPALAADWTIYAPDTAQIVELPKKEGDAVAAGDLLVRFDIAPITAEVSRSDLALAQAKARLDEAKTELTRISALGDQGLVARTVVDAARGAVLDAQSAVNRATGEVATAKAHLAQTMVQARFAGVVDKVWHVEGEVVAGTDGDPVIRVVDPTRLQVVAPLPMSDLMRISPGMAATITPAGAPDEAGTVVMRSTIADPTTRTADLRINFAGPTTLTMGTPVSVDIVIDTHPDLLIVPRAAIQHDDETSFVYVAGADNLAHRRAVQVGIGTTIQAQILSGLAAGDRVVTSGFDQLSDGMPIVIAR